MCPFFLCFTHCDLTISRQICSKCYDFYSRYLLVHHNRKAKNSSTCRVLGLSTAVSGTGGAGTGAGEAGTDGSGSGTDVSDSGGPETGSFYWCTAYVAVSFLPT